mgnify:CR=1 FL=1
MREWHDVHRQLQQLVDDVLRAGYQWKGTVVRPAMVRVKG